jgi:AAA+ ATPase superfamily predicted ATPase
MDIVGRIKEQEELDNIISDKRPSFLVVYGRRRVGKTF